MEQWQEAKDVPFKKYEKGIEPFFCFPRSHQTKKLVTSSLIII
jgi:hypothetical protein